MDSFAVLHITKYKSLSGIGAHIDRKHIPDNADYAKHGFNEEVAGKKLKLLDVLGKEVDPAKRDLNEQLYTGPIDEAPGRSGYKKLSDCVDKRIIEGHVAIDKRTGQVATIRKDAVKALGIILTGSHERMMQIYTDTDLFKKWKKDNYDFACRTWGEKNIVRFTLHMDEKTPHFHCVVVPINSEGRLCAKSFMNGSAQLVALQDAYAQAMERFDLNRGVSKVLSHRMHIQTRDYYKSATDIIEQTKELTAAIRPANLLKLHSIREEMAMKVSQLKISLMEQAHKLKYTAITNNSHMQSIKRAGVERGFQQDTVKACAYIKKEIPLIPFATEKLGWSIVKEKSTKKDVVLTHQEHGKIIVPTQPKEHTGHWVYSHTNGGGGTLVDLLRAEMWDWERIKELAKDPAMGMGYQQVYEKTYKKEINNELAEDDKRIIQKQRLEPEKQRQEVEKYLGGIVPAKNEGFLKNREIDKDTYRDMAGLTVSKQSAVFHLYNDFDKEGDKQLCSSITYYHDRMGDSKKFFQKDLPRGLSVLIEEGRDLRYMGGIFITESPVDALSYKQMNPEASRDMAFVSTCGSLSMGIKRDLEQVCQMAKDRDQSVVLGFDNDVAGRKMSEVVAAGLREEDIKYEVVVPGHGKDWNEELKWIHNPSLQRDQEMDKRMEQRQKELFEECAYEQSLLPKLGIEQETYLDFKAHVDMKCNEQALMVELKEVVVERRGEMLVVEADREVGLKGMEIDHGVGLNGVDTGREVEMDGEKTAHKGEIDRMEAEQVPEMQGIEVVRKVGLNEGETDRVSESKDVETARKVDIERGLEPERTVASNKTEVDRGKDVEAERGLEIAQWIELNGKEIDHGVELKEVGTGRDVEVSRGVELNDIESDRGLKIAERDVMDTSDSVEEKNVVAEERHVSRNWTLSMGESEFNELLSAPTASNKQEQAFVLNGDVEKAENIILVSSPMDAMMYYQQEAGKAVEAGQDRQEVADKHMKEHCYIYCPLEDREQAKEAVIEVIEQAYEREQKVAWVASKENDPLVPLMQEVEQNLDQEIEKVALAHDWKELANHVSEEMIANITMKPDVKKGR